MKLYVGNLHYNVTQAQLRELFSQAGEVTHLHLVTNKYTSKSSGFGFVTMGTEAEAKEAVARFHGHIILERPMTVHGVDTTANAWKGSSSTVVFRKSVPPPEPVVEVLVTAEPAMAAVTENNG